MMWVGDGKEVILLLRKGRSKWYALACIGRKRHYRKDGTCKHTDDVMTVVRPEMRARVKIDPWGGKRPVNQKETHEQQDGSSRSQQLESMVRGEDHGRGRPADLNKLRR